MDILIFGNERVIQTLHSLQTGQAEQSGKNPARQNPVENDSFKPSRFNYYQPAQSNWLVYNTLYNTLARLTNFEYEKLLGKKYCGKELIKKFFSEGLLVEENLNELMLYERWATMQRQIDKPYLSVNITTTLKCNARCYYCYEKGVRHKDLSDTQIRAVNEFIKSNLRENDMLALTWFGGEPLLNAKAFDDITNFLTSSGVKFSSYIITNGSLVTKKLVTEKFKRWNVHDVQITLDGIAETYEKRKAYVNQRAGIFNRILKKIAIVAESGATVHIRLNIDRNNMEEIFKLIEILEENFGNVPEISWYPAFLTEVGSDLTETEKIEFIKKLFSKLKNPTKMNAARRLHSLPKSVACMRNDPKSITVDVYGNVYTCEHLVGRKEESIGTLNDFDTQTNKNRIEVALRAECENCVFLPKCMGGCAVNLETDDEPCMIEKYIIQGYLAFMAER